MLSLLALLPAVAAQAPWASWCGKHYQYGAPNMEPGYTFPYPSMSSTPLLDFQCTPRSSYYLENDAQYDPPMIILDTNVTYDVGQSCEWCEGHADPDHGSMNDNVTITVMINGKEAANASVMAGTMGNLVPVSLDSLTASTTPYDVTCKATVGGQTFYTNSTLSYMVQPPWGGTCGSKIDRLTGATMVRNATAGEVTWKKILPIGFYDEIGQNSTVDPELTPLDRLYQEHQNGMNMVHVRPAFPPLPIMLEYLDTVEELGMYFVLDLTGNYRNATYVTYWVELLRNRSNLIGWYAADEPDGSDPASNATQINYDLIYSIDGYHPISVALNCENYKFIEYGINGADIIMPDPYPVSVGAAFSRVYGTVCNTTYGCCGCDNCEGSMYDVVHRIEDTLDRARILGMHRTKFTWGIPQAFDDYAETFWAAPPSGDDVAVQMIIELNHGAMGISPFDAPGSPAEAFTNASLVANMVNTYTEFFTDYGMTRSVPNNTLPYPGINNMDIASWSNGSMMLVTAANFYRKLPTQSFLLGGQGTIVDVLFGNVTAVNGTAEFIMPFNSIAAVVMEMSG